MDKKERILKAVKEAVSDYIYNPNHLHYAVVDLSDYYCRMQDFPTCDTDYLNVALCYTNDDETINFEMCVDNALDDF